MSEVFAFRPNRSISGVDPQAAALELERIRKEKKTLTPDNVVEEARAESSPLHAAFEWDDTLAAHQHRLAQARRLIVSVHVINSPIQPPVQVYVSVRTPEKGRSYVPTVAALNDEQLKARVLLEVRQFIESLERRYAHFRDVATILEGMKKSVG